MYKYDNKQCTSVDSCMKYIIFIADEEYFSDKASDVLMELTSGKMLQGQVICRGDDSFCYVHLYQVSGHSVSNWNSFLTPHPHPNLLTQPPPLSPLRLY